MEFQLRPLKLNGDNWVVWKFQTTVILKGQSLSDILTGSKENPKSGAEAVAAWEKEDVKAQTILVTRIEEGPLVHLLSCETSHEMWAKLKSVFDKESVVMSTYVSKLEEIRSKLKQAGKEISSKMVMTKILMSLPEHFRHFRSAWESVSENNQTLDELISRLLIEEEISKSADEVTALTSSSRRIQGSVQGNKNKPTCHFCHKVGHIQKYCFKKNNQKDKHCSFCKKSGHLEVDCYFKKNTKPRKQTNDPPDTNAFIGSSIQIGGNDWCMDTGALDYMCWKKDVFVTFSEANVNRKVKVGNGSLLDVKDIGNAELWAYNGCKLVKTTLTNVLFVPGLKFNLFSVGCALDKVYQMLSDGTMCKLVDKNGSVRALARRYNKLYKMEFVHD
ncbi:hypothetical protein HUJ05_009743, partial [Dendroctonus ponderosae]